MATLALEKPCRMDLRLTGSQRASYEEAAALKGQTLTQWSTSKLDEAAAADIEAARLTRLTGPAFEEFCSMLDAPLPESARELLAREEIWVDGWVFPARPACGWGGHRGFPLRRRNRGFVGRAPCRNRARPGNGRGLRFALRRARGGLLYAEHAFRCAVRHRRGMARP